MKRIFLWRDERNEIARLEYAIEDIQRAHAPQLEEARRTSSQALYDARQDEHFELSLYYDQINLIRTRQLIQAALRLGIPIPRRTDDHPHWRESYQLGEFYLSDEGQHQLRREIAHERELRHKPILSWGALAVSFVGLAISIIALTKD